MAAADVDAATSSASDVSLDMKSSRPDAFPLSDGYRYELLSKVASVPAAAVGSKIVHLVRHAQAEHNAACLAASGDRSVYLLESLHDARLTERGRSQAEVLRAEISAAGVEVDAVLVSPLSRCCQTAKIAFPACSRFVATETCRERNGLHPCDRRRSRTELTKEFPDIDFRALATDEDCSWTAERESEAALVARAEAFCAELAGRPEECIAVVAHNDFLQAFLLRSRLSVCDPSLRVPFENARFGSGVLVWR